MVSGTFSKRPSHEGLEQNRLPKIDSFWGGAIKKPAQL